LSYDQSGSFLGGRKRRPALPGLAPLLGCHSYWCTPPYTHRLLVPLPVPLGIGHGTLPSCSSGNLDKNIFISFYSWATMEYITVVGLELHRFLTQDPIHCTRSGVRGVITVFLSVLNFPTPCDTFQVFQKQLRTGMDPARSKS
jgi:hypothetical protein